MKRKLKSQLRAMRAQWCEPDEIIVSLIDFRNYSVLQWGVDNGVLTMAILKQNLMVIVSVYISNHRNF